MWRYLLVGFIGVVIGAAALVGIGLALGEPDPSPENGGSSVLCEDALARRRNAEQVLTQTYTPPTDSSRGTIAFATWQWGQEEAKRQRDGAIVDINRLC